MRRPDSDIDLLVEFLPDAEVGLVEHAGLMLGLQKHLGRKVDLVSKNGLKPRIRHYVLADPNSSMRRDDPYLNDIMNAADHIPPFLSKRI